MKLYLLFIIALSNYACSPFTALSEDVQIGHDEGYRMVYHPELQLKTRTFGDVKVVTDCKGFRELTDAKPAFNNILFYGHTSGPAYHYYVLLDKNIPRFDAGAYVAKDTVINQQPYVFLVSRSAPESDRTYILRNVMLLN